MFLVELDYCLQQRESIQGIFRKSMLVTGRVLCDGDLDSLIRALVEVHVLNVVF